jgi:hypothetical protein
MATGTVYLDVDDEITSAAARIRSATSTKVALVVPYGSRIATSRMNFRLLSREAIINNRRLSVVAADAATRALAASAGLPVFGSVGEYEESLGGDGTAAAAATPAATAAANGVSLDASETVVHVAQPVDEAPGDKGTPPAPPPSRRKRPPKATESADASEPVSDETQAVALPLPLNPAGPGPAVSTATARVPTVDRPRPDRSSAASSAAAGASRIPVIRSRRLPKVGLPVAIGSAIVALALLVGAVGAVVFLPAAEITVTPREEPIGPIELTVRADPDALAVDPDVPVVPAERLEIPVEVTQSFTTTGRRIEEAAASGEVTFSNLDFTSDNSIAAGSIVSTQSGVRFRTTEAVTVGEAKLVGLQIVPTEASVGVTAVAPGTAGNVEPNTIVVVPAAEDPTSLRVRNRAATTGGTHEEFPQIAQADIDAALQALQPLLADAFTAAVGEGGGASENAEVFEETAVLGEASPTVDPATLLGKEQASFDLGLRATGTVIAVDDSPVEAIAESRLLGNVGADYRLVDGSIDIVHGTPTVVGGEVSFPVTARASRVRLLDPAELLGLVKGLPVADAEEALGEFGDVVVDTWPDWVSTVPTMDSRVSLSIVGQTEPAPAGSGDPEGSREPTASEAPAPS